MDFSAIDRDPPHIVKGFDARQLQGTWYKASQLYVTATVELYAYTYINLGIVCLHRAVSRTATCP